ncbi:SDR family NAD(P)-dependent oxidoreductase [Rickettsiales bacterium]|nr:SDR family NAD(P)-dependent oxidoreductase [Rickettsiales bacterium]
MKILVTGAAGFIGFHVSKKLIEQNYEVIGIDNLNDYYDISLKNDRLKNLENDNFIFHKIDISDNEKIIELSEKYPDIKYIIHLAAQAGVRYSTENPLAYIQSNLVGHANMLELCRNLNELEHFIYASSSSVYGGNTKLPFSTEDRVDSPRSLYAATKKADELLTHSYAHLYEIPATGLRFFTVYGPWGRPDMATYLFTKSIIEGKPITVFNNGDMRRDFTYIDDIVDGIISVMKKVPENKPAHKVYNLGNNNSEKLMHFINILEQTIDKKAIIDFKPMHPGDVKETFADISDSKNDFGFSPKTSIEEGLPKFVEWYRQYYRS